MDASRYHKVLRVSTVVVTLVLLFDGGFLNPLTKELSDNTINYLANSVGITAAVQPNEANQLMQQLTERERALAEREREISSRPFGGDTQNDYSTYILSTILFILTVLIILNYALDWARVRKIQHEKQTA